MWRIRTNQGSTPQLGVAFEFFLRHKSFLDTLELLRFSALQSIPDSQSYRRQGRMSGWYKWTDRGVNSAARDCLWNKPATQVWPKCRRGCALFRVPIRLEPAWLSVKRCRYRQIDRQTDAYSRATGANGIRVRARTYPKKMPST